MMKMLLPGFVIIGEMDKIKVKIKKNTVQMTMLPQLYARCFAMKRWPGCFFDHDCIKIKKRISCDLSETGLPKGAVAAGALSVASRQFAAAAEIRDYLLTHPKAQVVLLGCGLDTAGHQADNSRCSFVNIDLDDVIELRKELIPDSERERNIAADLKDTGWISKLGYNKDNGAVFAALGLFEYWDPSEVKSFLGLMSRYFEGSRLVFNAQSRKGAAAAQRSLIKAGMTARIRFYMDDPEKELSKWKIRCKKISCKRMISDYRVMDKRFSFAERLSAAYSEKYRIAQMNVIDY